jgi:predicted nucleic acid-binding protein
MPGKFFDTSVLAYVGSRDEEKADIAERILEEGGAVSVQVLNELANVARRKMRLSWPETRGMLAIMRELLTVHPVSIETHEAGLEIAERYKLSVYDSMIVAAALAAECDILWSEDMQHGLVLERRLRVANPLLREL